PRVPSRPATRAPSAPSSTRPSAATSTLCSPTTARTSTARTPSPRPRSTPTGGPGCRPATLRGAGSSPPTGPSAPTPPRSGTWTRDGGWTRRRESYAVPAALVSGHHDRGGSDEDSTVGTDRRGDNARGRGDAGGDGCSGAGPTEQV